MPAMSGRLTDRFQVLIASILDVLNSLVIFSFFAPDH